MIRGVTEDWGANPGLNWPERLGAGDVVVDLDGNVAVVVWIRDCSPDSNPPRWEVYLAHATPGGVDVDLTEPWLLRPAPELYYEAERLGLFSELPDPPSSQP
jgi:hypothetical protein